MGGIGAGFDWYCRPDEITPPAPIIHATHDPMLPYAHGLALLRDLPHARLFTLEGSGHELHIDDWPVMVDAIVRHTGGRSGPSG